VLADGTWFIFGYDVLVSSECKRDKKRREKDETNQTKDRNGVDVTASASNKKNKTERWIVLTGSDYGNCSFYPVGGS